MGVAYTKIMQIIAATKPIYSGDIIIRGKGAKSTINSDMKVKVNPSVITPKINKTSKILDTMKQEYADKNQAKLNTGRRPKTLLEVLRNQTSSPDMLKTSQINPTSNLKYIIDVPKMDWASVTPLTDAEKSHMDKYQISWDIRRKRDKISKYSVILKHAIEKELNMKIGSGYPAYPAIIKKSKFYSEFMKCDKFTKALY